MDKPIKNFTIPEGINFVSIDPKTGLLATDTCEKIIVEAFIEGTEPTEYSTANKPSVDKFYMIDSNIEDIENETKEDEIEENIYYYSD